MKKLILIPLIALLAVSCKDDPAPTSNGYSTDGLSINNKKNALLLFKYDPKSTLSVGYQLVQKMAESDFGKNLNTITIGSGLLKVAVGDSLTDKFVLGSAPSFFINEQASTLPMLIDDVEGFLDEAETFVGVSTSRTSNDTAWIVDVKVRFFDDTLTNGLYVETYMLGNIDARYYNSGAVNLTTAESAGLVVTKDSMSVWDDNYKNLDSTKTVVSKGDKYRHENILLANFSKINSFGTNLATYTPFGIDFQKNDVIGTKDTPIRHHFLKPENDPKNPEPYSFSPEFVTVIWYINHDTGEVIYIDSQRN